MVISENGQSRIENISKLQEEIQTNYRELQNKLSEEFQEKMREWEKLKINTSNNAFSSTAQSSTISADEAKDQAFKKKMDEWEKIKGQTKFHLQSEEHLPPEFRKKLHEWEKMKKMSKDDNSSGGTPRKKFGEWPRWKSISGHRPEPSHYDYPPLSEDFLKKLETWKQMKTGGGPASDDYEIKDAPKINKTPSPRLTRKDGSSSRQSKKIKDQTEKEVHWFEKELTKIEREKQRLERERQKFMEREER